MDWTALSLTLQLAASTTAILGVIGLPLAYWLGTTRHRAAPLIEAMVTLPLVLPPSVLGYYLLVLLSPESPPGRLLLAVTGNRLPFTFGGILIGSVVFNLPFTVRPFAAAFANIDPRLIEASWCLGVSRWQTFRRIVLPLAWRGLLAGLVLTFAHALGEFGVVLMVGGSIPGVTRTLSLSIYDDVQALDYRSAGRSSLLLVGVSLAALYCVQSFTQRGKSP